jgi:hypothetical protein
VKINYNWQLFILFLATIFLLPRYNFGQDEHPIWKSSEANENFDLHLFRSTQSINLPTAETLKKNNLQFEISHRFIPTIKTGVKDFWGFDGPVNIRIALSYAPFNHTMITLGRGNLDGNIDFRIKQNILQLKNDILPTVLGARIGAAWNSRPSRPIPGRTDLNSKNFQYYGQLIINSMYDKKLGVGIVPSYLYNSYIFTDNTQYSFTFGSYITYYATKLLGLTFEWNPTVTGFRVITNPVAFGIELYTGGHFFKIILTNSEVLNPSQFLAGSLNSFNSGEWHIGFNITRLFEL